MTEKRSNADMSKAVGWSKRSQLLRIVLVCTTLTVVLITASTSDSQQVPADLRMGDLRVGKVLFLGNSITLHGPAEQIGWLGNWGMAASAIEKDFVHLLLARIAEAAQGRPASMVKNIADFERTHPTYDISKELKPELEFTADLVVVAIGENVPAIASDEAKTRYRIAFSNLLAELKRRGQPTLIVRSCFWADPAKDEIMRKASEEAGAIWVDVGTLGKDDRNFARAERDFQVAAVGAHPGDRGMLKIADAIWAAIQQKAKPR